MTKKVVVFTSPTCGPCKRLKPELKFQSEHLGFELEVVELAQDGSNRDRFRDARVSAVPVTVLMEDGKEIDRFQGGMTPTAISVRMSEWGLD